MGIEFELKYQATPAQQAALLARFGTDAKVISMETTYYDTRDQALSARHITLRRRMENGISVCTVKTPAGAAGRGEWECLCGDIRAAIPELCKLGAPEYILLLTAAGVEPFCGAKFTRRAMEITTVDFTAELALDSGVLTGGGREEALCEVELELKSGDPRAMTVFMENLAAQYGMTPEPRSKIRRAKCLADNETP